MPDQEIQVLAGLAESLAKKIRGQEHVCPSIARILARGELNLTDSKRPKGSFLFVGPTGVGKTEMCLEMARILGFQVYRLDMSEFQLQASVPELLERFVYMVDTLGDRGLVLFDEIEKAHPLVLDILLQVLDAARATIKGGRIISFKGYYIGLTSNIGAREAMRAKHTNDAMFQKAIIGRVQRELRPELFNRIALKCAFRALEWDVQCLIAADLVKGVCFRTKGGKYGVDVQVDSVGLRRIVEKGIDRDLGARPLRNVAEDLIEFAIATAIIQGRKPTGILTADVVGDDLVFQNT